MAPNNDYSGTHHAGTGIGTSAGMDNHTYPSHATDHHHAPATGGFANEPGTNYSGRHEYDPVGVGSGANDPYAAAGVGHHHDIPPSSALHAGSATSGERHSGGSLTGKMERKVGDVIGSKSLKAKGMQKEQEAQALKVQSSELAEAERLEREAAMRRERAVAHGAHPDNKHLGAGHIQ
ncbi:hypothetical protein V5O48_003000 [Marasmius crinis-equi]|uniref:Uncharacterized protein n=1 Tax=Marasmius crinis-equi TaxID=585013 RepID=A0ABR3FU25_9AGAR